MENTIIIQQTFRFINELPRNFIEDIWGTDTNLGSHFRMKFNGFCNAEGYASANAILKFFNALTVDHQRKLSKYISDWCNKQNLEN